MSDELIEKWEWIKSRRDSDWTDFCIGDVKTLVLNLESLQAKVEALEAEFMRMENAWRGELETWYRGEDVLPNKSLLVSLNGKLKETEARLAKYEDKVLPEEAQDVLNEIESAHHTNDDQIRGYDYHTYCIIHEGLAAAQDFIERLSRTEKP